MSDAGGIEEGIRAGLREILACWREARGEEVDGPLMEGVGRLLGAFAEFLGDPAPLEEFGREGTTRALVREISGLQHSAGRDAVGVLEDYAAMRRCVWSHVERRADLSAMGGAEVARFSVKLMQAADWAAERSLEAYDEFARGDVEGLVGRAEATDLLTGLPDRDLFHRKLLPDALAANDRAALVVFDLLHFSETVAGGEVARAREALLNLAGAVGEAVPAGAVRARFGDDEVGVLLPDTTAEEAYAFAEKVLARLLEGGEAEADAGVAAYPEHGADAEVLVAAAMGALSIAKRVGGGGIVVAH